ncbi:ATP-dependent DNA ligase [Candidatus Woesearchaeota archaeon]|nr:ATP-dependent DNA ligase [Candidatus Woesearchaeota archaeon]
MEYKKLVDLYEKLFSTSKRLEKTYHIAKFLKNELERENSEVLSIIFLMLRGRIFPDWDDTNLGFAAKMAIKSITSSSGLSQSQIESWWKELGDLGLVAEKAMSKKKQSTLFTNSISLQDVYSNLKKLSEQEGQGSNDRKVKLVNQLLTSASPKEAKYIIRIVLEDMRVGIGDSTLRDSIFYSIFAGSFDYDFKQNILNYSSSQLSKSSSNDSFRSEIIVSLQDAYDIANDWSIVFDHAKNGISDLEKIKLTIGKPLKVMLFPKAVDFEDAFERLGKPCAFEFKYDGFRMQIHKDGNDVTIFTRRLDTVTEQFPEIQELVNKNIKADTCILDAEAVGIGKDGRYRPFQDISQRIKRKHDIDKLVKELPIELNIFDILYLDGKTMIKESYAKRREALTNIITTKKMRINISEQIITEDISTAKRFFDKALEVGNEGLMAKKLDAPYKPGARVGYGMKIKGMKESLDLVIIKAEYGEGKRAGWLTSFTVACMDEDGVLLEIGKVSTGLKEKDEEGTSFNILTQLLIPLIISESGKEVTVKPRIIIEIGYEELQRSQTYSSGYALRFPRFLNLREDRSVDEITTIDYLDKLYLEQK